ncbi:hypothetical protein [Microcoleus sp. Pol10D4]|uniref:hypothetical protein n=1 Tax=Microcoleus sp. Pol10D4 TaxID=3055387 RepID=UPI002FD1F675
MKTQAQKVLDEFCPQCDSQEIRYDEDFGFYKCLHCEHCWGYDEDDPDDDEVDNLGNEDLN